MEADLLIYNASQLLTVAAPQGPKRGEAMRDLGIIENGAVAVRAGRILAVGATDELHWNVDAERTIDADGHVVMPGFVDPHTHLVFGGSREGEFEMRLQGATYMDIMNAGGGIMNTVRQTRSAGADELVQQALPRLRRMLAHGTTTAESKSGYGLTVADELKQLEVNAYLETRQPIELASTFLGAHAVPSEYAGRTDAFVDLVIDEMLPAVVRWHRDRPLPFCDVFCEDGVFSYEQTRRILTCAQALGFPLKIHVDEFKALGGTGLGVELGATSVDHIVCTPPEEVTALAHSDTIGVSLPGTPFGLAHRDYSPARAIIDQGGTLALATDLNPGTCYCESMPFIISLACRYMKLWPAEAIAAATINAAHAIRRGESVGSIEIGKQADLLILDLPNYRLLPYRFGTNPVHTVIKRGVVVVE